MTSPLLDHYLALADQWVTRAAMHHNANEASMGQTAAAIGNALGALAQAVAVTAPSNGLVLPTQFTDIAPTLVQPGQGPAVAAPMTTTPEVTA